MSSSRNRGENRCSKELGEHRHGVCPNQFSPGLTLIFLVSFFVCFCFGDWGLNSELCTCKRYAQQLEPYLHFPLVILVTVVSKTIFLYWPWLPSSWSQSTKYLVLQAWATGARLIGLSLGLFLCLFLCFWQYCHLSSGCHTGLQVLYQLSQPANLVFILVFLEKVSWTICPD
jgi:hypothetical protein